MSEPEPNKRGFLLPAGCKDIADALRMAEQGNKPPPPPPPPVSYTVDLPPTISVSYLAKLVGWPESDFRSFLAMHRIVFGRTVEFSDVKGLLRQFGIHTLLSNNDPEGPRHLPIG